MLSLRSIVSKAYVICYKEDVRSLVLALENEGFEVIVNRQPTISIYKNYSPSVKCLVNHHSVWTQLVNHEPAIVVEADFVPVCGMGNFDCPFPPSQSHKVFAYLYGCGIEIYDLVESKYARGHSSSAVAYYLSPLAAKYLNEFVEEFLSENDPKEYSTWDSNIRKYIQDRGVNSYIPFRNFGEHGGYPNIEHKEVWLNGRIHRADVLAGSLYFLPRYANQSRFLYLVQRCRARAWGIGRILFSKILKYHDIRRQKSPLKMLGFVFKRQVTFFKWS